MQTHYAAVIAAAIAAAAAAASRRQTRHAAACGGRHLNYRVFRVQQQRVACYTCMLLSLCRSSEYLGRSVCIIKTKNTTRLSYR